MFETAIYSVTNTDHGVVERIRISSLENHGKALKKECCLPGVFCDTGDTPANLLSELNGHLMPCTRRIEDVHVCWPIWSICLFCSVLSCGLLHLVYLLIIILLLLPRTHSLTLLLFFLFF